jgi:hypothetical protein
VRDATEEFSNSKMYLSCTHHQVVPHTDVLDILGVDFGAFDDLGKDSFKEGIWLCVFETPTFGFG